MGKSKYLLIIAYWLALFLLFMPLLKQGILSYKLAKVPITTETTMVEQPVSPIEAVQPPTFSEVLAFQGTKQPTAAQLFIPSMEFVINVFPSVTQESLLAGAGMMYAERNPANGNFVLLGHHLGKQELLFGQLLSLAGNEDIYLHYSGKSYHYKVADTQLIKETDFTVLEETPQPRLTLITCDKPTQTDQRFVVTADLQETTNQDQKSIDIQRKLIKISRKRNASSAFLVIIGIFSLMIVGALIILRQLRGEETK